MGVQEVVKDIRIPKVEYIEKVEEIALTHYEEGAQEIMVPQQIEYLKQVPKHEYQHVEKPVEVPVITVQEKIVEAKEIFTTEVLKPIPKIQFWEVVKEKQAVEEEDFVETSKTEIVVV